MKRIVSTWLKCLLAVTVFLLIGCKDPVYDELEFSRLTFPPKPAEISMDGPSFVTEGISVAISVRPLSENGEDYQVTDEIDIVSQDESILLVSPSLSGSVFVLTAFNVGQTCMEVSINGKVKDCIDIEVVE